MFVYSKEFSEKGFREIVCEVLKVSNDTSTEQTVKNFFAEEEKKYGKSYFETLFINLSENTTGQFINLVIHNPEVEMPAAFAEYEEITSSRESSSKGGTSTSVLNRSRLSLTGKSKNNEWQVLADLAREQGDEITSKYYMEQSRLAQERDDKNFNDFLSKIYKKLPVESVYYTLRYQGYKVSISDGKELSNSYENHLSSRALMLQIPPFSAIDQYEIIATVRRITEELHMLIALPEQSTGVIEYGRPSILDSGLTKLVRVGFLSTARVSSKTFHGIERISDRAVVQAVASRSLEKAEAWCGARDIEVAYGTYQELLDDDQIDAVYVPLPNSMHLEWVKRAALKKKAVLVEKPVAVTSKELAEILDVCKENNVQFMDGTMFPHHNRTKQVKEVMDSPDFGSIVRVNISFHYMADKMSQAWKNNIRSKADLEPLGVLGNLGWYCIHMSLWVFNWEIPKKVYCFCNEQSEEGVPLDVVIRLEFSKRRIALIDTSFCCTLRQFIDISSEKSRIRMDDFVIPKSVDLVSFEVIQNSAWDYLQSNVNEDYRKIEVKDCCQEANMWTNFCKLIQSPNSIPSSHWSRVSYIVQVICDACLASMAQDSEKIDPRIFIDFKYL